MIFRKRPADAPPPPPSPWFGEVTPVLPGAEGNDLYFQAGGGFGSTLDDRKEAARVAHLEAQAKADEETRGGRTDDFEHDRPDFGWPSNLPRP